MNQGPESSAVPQDLLMEEVLPVIRSKGRKYRKFKRVRARPAVPGEKVVSTTSEGQETANTAQAGDVVVQNLTEAKEQYLVGGEKFQSSYSFQRDDDNEWKLYQPRGQVLGLEVTCQVTSALGVGEQFSIMAAWESPQRVRLGDMLVTPLPSQDEIYRIARREFEETYKPVAPTRSA